MLQVAFDPIIAEAYRRAALDGRDMYGFAGQMDRFKTDVPAQADLYQHWDHLDDLIGDTLWNNQDVQHLALLRQALLDALEGILTQAVLQPGAEMEADWARWRQAFAEASFHWRLDAMDTLCNSPVWDKRFGQKLEPYRRFVFCFRDRRWVETRAVFEELATDPAFSDEYRGYHTYVCGQVDLYFHYAYDQAKSLFDTAKNLLSGKPLALHGWIEYYLKGPEKERNIDQALALAEEALRTDPKHVPSIIQKADVLVEKGQLAEAENLYRAARQIRPGNTLVYTRLIDLFGKPELFEKKGPEIESLLQIDVQLDPGTGYLTWGDVGVLYQQQGETHWPAAEQYLEKAVALYPEGIMNRLNLGYFYLDVTKQLDRAETVFQQVVDLAPEAREGYLAQARLREAQEQWAAAIPLYERVQAIIPSWERFMQATAGRCHRLLEQWDEAEKALLQAWKLDAYEDSGALSELYEMAQQLYKHATNPQPDRAVQLLDRTAQRPAIAPVTAAGMANRQGHALFYVERFDEALVYYQRAATMVPAEPVYFTNQADCLDKLYRQSKDDTYYHQAMEALDQAAKVAPQDSSIAKKRRQFNLVRHNPHLAQLPELYQVYVEVGQPLLGEITQDFQTLLPGISALTEQLRQRMNQRYAVNLPGIRYRDIQEAEGVYQFRLYETPVVLDRLSEGSPLTMAAVLERLEDFIRQYGLDQFINYWDVDKEVPLLPNAELVHFTRAVMALLAEQIPLPPLAQLHQQYRRLDGFRLPVARVVEQLRLLDTLRTNLPGVQPGFHFCRLGENEERLLSGCLIGQDDNRALAVPVEYAGPLLGAVIRFSEAQAGKPVALVTRKEELRPFLRSVLVGLPHIPVLKDPELPADAETRFLPPFEIQEQDRSVFQDAIRTIHPNIAPDAQQP